MCKRRYLITATAYDRRGNILASRQNEYSRSHPLQKEMSVRAGLSEERISLHAEISAIITAQKTRRKIHRLFVERYDAQGNPRIAKPCKSCSLAIQLAGIEVVEYTTEQGIRRGE